MTMTMVMIATTMINNIINHHNSRHHSNHNDYDYSDKNVFNLQI